VAWTIMVMNARGAFIVDCIQLVLFAQLF